MTKPPIQLYSLATPNGQKVSIALEEMSLPYVPNTINILKDEQFTETYKKINPNSKIPSIVDPLGPKGQPLAIMESGAILVYLAEKSGQFLSQDPIQRSQTLQWLFFQIGHIGPMFGQFGHFYKYAKEKCDHPYPVERYTNETKRLLQVLDECLSQTAYIAGSDYSIADMAIFPWVLCLSDFYKASEHLALTGYNNLNLWIERVHTRPAVKKGLKICPI